MKRFFSTIPKFKEETQANTSSSNPSNEESPSSSVLEVQSFPLKERTGSTQVVYEPLKSDPAQRKLISDFHPNVQDEVRRAYLNKGPFQPRGHVYPVRKIGKQNRSFVENWFNEYDWLEYSIEKDDVYCLPCFLFKNLSESGGEHFVTEGFSQWHKKGSLNLHVGLSNSPHNKAVRKCKDLMNPNQSIGAAMIKQTEQGKSDYRIRLKASVVVVRFLVRGGLAFRGHDESKNSSYKGHFLKLLEFLGKNNEEIGRVLESAPENHKMTSPDIQKDIANACAYETVSEIIKEIGDDFFCVLIDEAGDCADKEQMAVVLRFVDDKGFIMERYIGIVHVKDTTASSLKSALVLMLSGYGLCISRIRGQGYDGASNMRGRLGGLKTLIQKENPSAHYVHCFAHQLQLSLIAVVKCHSVVNWFFAEVTRVVNIIQSSNKRQDMLREKQAAYFENLVKEGLIKTGKGLNQHLSLIRAGDTRWGSHFKTLTSLMDLFSPIIDVLEELELDRSSDKNGEAVSLLYVLQTFDFVFMLHLMTDILGVSNDLSLALQRRDQDILNALKLVTVNKHRFQEMRDDGWEDFLKRVVSSCDNFKISVPDMNAQYVKGQRSRRQSSVVSNLHHYKYDCFYNILDLQLKELDDRFTVENTELLRCVACLCPSFSFEAFDLQALMKMTEFYPNEFCDVSDSFLSNQFKNYIEDVKTDSRFSKLQGISELCRTLVQTKKDKTYCYVFLLVKLALILPMATASVERVFSSMNFVKNAKRNKMGDQWLNDCLVSYVERDVFSTISDEDIMQRFQNLKERKGRL